jgi:ubiquinone/menaquinone biosynthesis C-methylase UbiE
MNDDYPSLYSDAQRYDLVEGAFATADFLDFYRRQIVHYGEPVLELACGSGRLTIPLAESGVKITGLDISEEMLNLATLKASERGVKIPFVRGDVRSFNLGAKFKFIFIAAQSLTHLHKREEIEDCLSCVRWHLAEDGRFLVELFNPSVKLLARDSDHRYGVGEYEDQNGGKCRVFVTEEVRYDTDTQINHIRWFFRNEGYEEEAVLSFDMRQFFPQEIDALLWYNGFLIEHKYGSYDEKAFCGDSPKQLIVCRSK